MWVYNNQEFTSAQIQDHFGFVYRLTDLTNGKQYIGRKVFWFYRKNSKRKRIKKESDWATYCSSSETIQELVRLHGVERFRREIISLHKSRGALNYHEIKQLFLHDVLQAVNTAGERAFYNQNIMGRYWPKSIGD